jgi:hypothetical protein
MDRALFPAAACELQAARPAADRPGDQTREEVFLNSTPQGDVVVAHLEGDDPRQANRQFAASSRPYDRWFKDSLKELFPPLIDFDQPVPPNETVWAQG